MAFSYTSNDGTIKALIGLRVDNMQEYFDKEYTRWRFKNSHEVKIDGVIVDNFVKESILVSTEKLNAKEVTVSDTTSKGFPLTEHDFILEQLRKYEPMYNKTIGEPKNIEFNKTAKYYIDFLKAKLENKQVDDYSELYKGLVPNYIQNLSLPDFNEIMTYKRLPDYRRGNKFIWDGKKGWCLLLFRSYGFTTPQVKKVFEGNFHDNQLKVKPSPDFLKLLGNQ